MNSVRSLSFYFLIFLLVAVGSALTVYRHVTFDIPWLPESHRQIWSVEAKVEFEAMGRPVLASLAIPSSQPGFERLSEHTASPGFGLAFTEVDGSRRAEWSIRYAQGAQTLYYQVDLLAQQTQLDGTVAIAPPLTQKTYAEPEATAVQQLLWRAQERSANPKTLARELIFQFNNEAQTAQMLEQTKPRNVWLVEMLHLAKVPARRVQALVLEDGRRRQNVVDMLQVFEGDRYWLIDPMTGEQGQKPNQLLWEQNSQSIIDLIGGENANVSFSMIEQEVPVSRLMQTKTLGERNLLDLSIHSLPLEEQTLFKNILLIPVGVLIVVLLRILVGLRTSGTFMPVLIAMAFIQTSLVTGLVGFFMVVGVGLLIRGYLSRHNLLLVARISAVIVSVIMIIAVFSILAFELGLTEGLKITFFPMIILAWTIERMSILWEEEGAKEVMVQGGGALLVALVAYFVMSNAYVRHLAFNFIGLQFLIMAAVLVCGNYTGYRLLELYRFKVLSRD